MTRLRLPCVIVLGVSACAGRVPAPAAPLSRAADAAMLPVPGGPYVAGSTPEEREQAYQDAERTAGDARARRGHWFAREEPRHEAWLGSFRLDRTHVTNAAYREFVVATGRRGPSVDRATWSRQGYVQDYDREVARFNWRGQRFPDGRAWHPVVLVTYAEAAAYCAWRGRVVGAVRFLPSAAQLEKAMRGTDGRAYPWGDAWDDTRLNQAVTGPRDTEPVAAHAAGAGPYGHLDLAGEAFHWTSTPWPGRAGEQTLRGSAWDDHAGVGRGAQRHGRPRTIRHAVVGFRCAGPGAEPENLPGTGMACDSLVGVCLDWGYYCDGHADCAADQACNDHHRCVSAQRPCATPVDCSSGYACDRRVGRCESIADTSAAHQACEVATAPPSSPCRAGEIGVDGDRWVECLQTGSAGTNGAICELDGPYGGFVREEPTSCQISVHYKTVRMGSNVWCSGTWWGRPVGKYER